VKLNIYSWLIWALFPLALVGGTYSHAVGTTERESATNAAAIKQIHHDSRVSALVAFMEAHHFAQDQYQYVNQIIKDADSNQIPAALLVCIDLQESSGGKRYYRSTFNPFGWGSDQISFASERVAIDYISRQLGSGRYYAGKSIEGKLHAYNPNPEYSIKIINCINQIK
jgi:hypothetical protein